MTIRWNRLDLRKGATVVILCCTTVMKRKISVYLFSAIWPLNRDRKVYGNQNISLQSISRLSSLDLKPKKIYWARGGKQKKVCIYQPHTFFSCIIVAFHLVSSFSTAFIGPMRKSTWDSWDQGYKLCCIRGFFLKIKLLLFLVLKELISFWI